MIVVMTRLLSRFKIVAGAFLLLPSLCPSPAHAKTQKIERMYVFGDSYSDIGAGYVDGNGPTAVFYYAQRLGFQLYPANVSDVSGKSLDFAISGAKSGRGLGQEIKGSLLGYGMENQVSDFVAKVKSGAIQFDPGSTLFFLAGGLNDADLPPGSTAANEKSEIRTLYALGARRFEVALLTTAIPVFFVTGQKINPSLQRIPAELHPELKDADIRLSRWGLFYDQVLANAAKYGFTNTTDACAGRAIFNQSSTPCPHPETYFFYHENHPSTATHKAVGDLLYAELH